MAETQAREFSARVTTWVRRMLMPMVVLVLAGCAGSGPFAPISNLSDRGVDGLYTVRAGDTLTSISRDTGVSVERLSALNNISNPSLIRVGQRLRLNDSASLAAAPASTAATSSSSMARSRMGDESSDAQSTAPAASSSQTVTRANDAGRIDLGWPAKGQIIQRFTPQTKGIDIAGKVGDPVLAAGAGKVVYAGDGVRGLGNLVIVDHGDGFITAYAHNDRILVKSGDSVKKGAQIATMGQSDAASPRLHFEVRRQGTPVDPMRYLPSQS